MLALYLACSVIASPYLLAYDLLPLTFAAVALLASTRLDASGAAHLLDPPPCSLRLGPITCRVLR